MALGNTETSWGWVSRALHWAIAALVLAAIPLGLLAGSADITTDEGIARAVRLFSVHKTLGALILVLAVLRLIWAALGPRPVPVHPERRGETAVAAMVHVALYAGLLIVPLAGWIGHAATTGYAPMLLPFGDTLPFVPKSEPLAERAFAIHWLVTKVLAALVLLHVAGALKHALVDRDGTLARMVTGREAGDPSRHGVQPAWPAMAAAALWLAAVGAGTALPGRVPGTGAAPATSVDAGTAVVSAEATLGGQPTEITVRALTLPDPGAVLGQGTLDAEVGGVPLSLDIVRAPDGDVGFGSYGDEPIELGLTLETADGRTTLTGTADTASGPLVVTIVAGTP